MNLRAVVKATRERLGLSQGQLAKRLGVKRPTVSGWESGAHGMRPAHAKKFAKLAGLTYRAAELADSEAGA